MKNNMINENKKNKSKTFWLFVALFAALVLSSLTGSFFSDIFAKIFVILTPILIGMFLAFVLKKLLIILENKVFTHWFDKTKHPFRNKRIFCLIVIFVVLVLLIIALIWLVVPKIISFFTDLSQNVETFVSDISTQITNFLSGISWLSGVDIQSGLNEVLQSIFTWLGESIPVITATVLSILSKTALYLMFIVIGFIIAFLFLKDKEKVSTLSKRWVYAYCDVKKANKIIDVTHRADTILYDYFVGKFIEALIIFAVMLPGFYAFNIPYTIGLCVLLAVLNAIPYVGALIALIPIMLFSIFFTNVSTALWLLLYINIMLILVGNLISPALFGKKLKVSSLLIVVAFVFGGGLFGIWGMFFAPPVAAILWVFFNEMLEAKEQQNLVQIKKEEKKDIKKEQV